MAKIDIDRFICSLIKLNGFAGMYNLSNTRKALELQGLKYDSETDEIVSIEPEFNGTPIRAGRWYVCDCETINENQTVAFHRDETYYCPKDGWLDVKGLLFEVGSLNIDFRPATEEEIPHEPYFKVGDRVRRKGTNTKGDVITNIYESGGVTMYEFENSEDAPQSLSWELVDNSQRMKSAKAKEALLNDGEMTEFEKGVKKWLGFNSTQPNDEDLKMIRKAAEDLLSIARKQFQPEFDAEVEQAYKNQDEVVYNRGYDKGYNEAIEDACEWLSEKARYYFFGMNPLPRGKFIEDFKKALEKRGK